MIREELLAIMDQAAREGWTELDLNNQEITELPPEIGQLADLQRLDLSFNQLTTTVAEIAQLSCLQILILRDNQFTAIPPEITQLAKLQTLDLTRNSLREIPPEIGQLNNLQSLNVSLNQLLSLPPDIHQLIFPWNTYRSWLIESDSWQAVSERFTTRYYYHLYAQCDTIFGVCSLLRTNGK